MIYVTDGADVAVRLGALKFFFCHSIPLLPRRFLLLDIQTRRQRKLYLLVGFSNIENKFWLVKGEK